MKKIKFDQRENGCYIRCEYFELPGIAGQKLCRRYVLVDGEEYEMAREFSCEFMIGLHRHDRPIVYACIATDSGEGEVEVIPTEFLIPCGYAFVCNHSCAYKKRLAEWCAEKTGVTHDIAAILAGPETITLNAEILEGDDHE